MKCRLATPLILLAALVLLCSRANAQPQLFPQRDAKRECATCHIDWMVSFDRPGAVLLMEKPEKPTAATEPVCLECHDGSVGDSRRGVWLEHGHRRNEKPSDKIKVPENMPLEDGKMTCRTCHTAHTVPGANDISKIVFLRAATEGGLCQQCHKDRAYGAEHGSHPLAKLPFELPKPIYDAHGRMDIADKTKMACQTCHTSHGQSKDHLLVMGTESGQLCQTCHEKLRPMEWKVDAPREHPQNPIVKDPKQKAAIAALGTRLGPNDTLTCFSCHKMHDSKSSKFMLADSLNNSAICLRCHEDRKVVMGSKHDLQVSKPTEKNRLGLTPDQSGSCGACHSFHRYARDVQAGRGDPTGRCITCHTPRTGDNPTGLGFAHPPDIDLKRIPQGAKLNLLAHKDDPSKRSLACNTCHDPHDASKTLFLKVDKNNLCSTCHTDRFASMGGTHDFTKKPELKNARGWTAEQAGKCGFCHAVHGDTERVLWVGTKEKPKGPDDLCLQCHKEGGLAAKKPAFAFSHSTGPKATLKPGMAATQPTLPLFNANALVQKDGFVSCASCHDPHINTKEMLRVEGPTSNLCSQCHQDKLAMSKGPHDGRDKDKWPVQSKHNDLCTSCHMPHGNDPVQQRWAFKPGQAANLKDGACVSCHKDNMWAGHGNGPIPLGKALHPTTLPSKGHAGTEKSGLPLLSSKDKPDTLFCGTCHNPHAPTGTAKLARIQPNQGAEALCAKCHTETHKMAAGMHGRDVLMSMVRADPDSAPFKLDSKSAACAPCHATHAVEGSQRPLLWANKLAGEGATDTDKRCLSCHQGDSRPGKNIAYTHPIEPLKVMASTSTRPSSTTQPSSGMGITEIKCITCHTPHGGSDSPLASTNIDIRRADKPMVRSDTPRLCAGCHGVDATRMFLYWHSTAKRSAVQRLIGK